MNLNRYSFVCIGIVSRLAVQSDTHEEQIPPVKLERPCMMQEPLGRCHLSININIYIYIHTCIKV